MGEERRDFHRFRPDDPMRIEWRARQVDRVRAYGRLSKDSHTEDENCSCQDFVSEMVTMIEDLHKKIDVLDPDSVRH